MKKFKKLLAFVVLIAFAPSITLTKAANNKQQIFFTNEYGDEVTAKLSWQSKNFPYFTQDEVIELREHDKNFMVKAPYSYYKFVGLSVSPHNTLNQDSNIANSQQDFEVPLIASNEDSLDAKHVGNHTYFIIKASHKNSAVPGQKKIYTQGYASQQKYASEIAKTEHQIKTVAQQAIPVVHAVPVQEPARMPEPVQQPVQIVHTVQTSMNNINPNLNNQMAHFENVQASENMQIAQRSRNNIHPSMNNQRADFESAQQAMYQGSARHNSRYAPEYNPVVLSHPFDNY